MSLVVNLPIAVMKTVMPMTILQCFVNRFITKKVTSSIIILYHNVLINS